MSQKLVYDIPRTKKANSVAGKLAACSTGMEDLEAIYSNKFLTDMELKTKSNSFPAHKIVLCARSPVFKHIFINDMKEKNSSSIQVDDLEDDTVQQLLLFVYSDKIECLKWETACKLYYAADKYQIEKLKLICGSFLIDNLTTSTATELLLLADTHSDSDLQKIVRNFIMEHDEQIFSSANWVKFMEANPRLALKTMHLKYQTKEKHLPESYHNHGDKVERLLEVSLEPKNCFLCDKTFPNSNLYETHLVHVHMEWAEPKGLVHNDGDCPNDVIRTHQMKEFLSKEELVDIAFPSNTEHYCDVCDTLVSNYPQYYLHMQKDHGAEKCFRCVIQSCLKTFTSPSMFEKHIQKHKQEVIHNCSFCGITFKRQEELTKHRKTKEHKMLSFISLKTVAKKHLNASR